MFVVSQEKKGKLFVTSLNHTHNLEVGLIKPQNIVSNQSQVKTVLPIPEFNIVKNITMPPTSIVFNPIRNKIRFRLSRDPPTKPRKSKRQRDIRLKLRRNKEEAYATGRWKLEEHQRFVDAIVKYGNDWKQVQKYVRTRSSTQARSHAQKFFVKIRSAKIFNFNLDLTKNSIKMLRDFLSSLSSEESKRILKVLYSVAFERKNNWKKVPRKSSINLSDNGLLNDKLNDGLSLMNIEIEDTNHDTLGIPLYRRLSIERDPYFQNRRHTRRSMNSLDCFNAYIEDNELRGFNKRESFDDREYINCFNNHFNITERNPCSRKVSQDEEYLLTYISQNFKMTNADINK